MYVCILIRCDSKDIIFKIYIFHINAEINIIFQN